MPYTIFRQSAFGKAFGIFAVILSLIGLVAVLMSMAFQSKFDYFLLLPLFMLSWLFFSPEEVFFGEERVVFKCMLSKYTLSYKDLTGFVEVYGIGLLPKDYVYSHAPMYRVKSKKFFMNFIFVGFGTEANQSFSEYLEQKGWLIKNP